jgi:hypothetical protein
MHARGSHRCGGSEASEVHVRCAGTRALSIGTRCGREARGSRRSIVRNGKTEPAQTLVGLLPPFQIDSKLARGGEPRVKATPPRDITCGTGPCYNSSNGGTAFGTP